MTTGIHIVIRDNNPGQPYLDGAFCNGCPEKATRNIQIDGQTMYVQELRFCDGCLKAVYEALRQECEECPYGTGAGQP